MLLSLFVACFIPLLAVCWLSALIYSRINTAYEPLEAWRWGLSLVLALAIGGYGLRKKSLNKSGFVAGIVVGFLVSMGSLCFFAALLAFFIGGSKITNFKAAVKKKIEAEFKEGGQRNWVQVISNGGPATIFSILFMIEIGSKELPFDFKSYYNASWYAMALLASLSSACGDTFASEIGSVVGTSDPFLITAWKRVPRGTNGGVSVGGTIGSLVGGLLVGCAYYGSLLLFVRSSYINDAPPQWPILIYATIAGGLGSLVDSIIGATLQFSGRHKKLGIIVEHDGPDVKKICGRDVLDNHSVNLVSSIITGLVMPYLSAVTWTYFMT